MSWSRGEIEDAWTHARENVREVQVSTLCVCFQCQSYFSPAEIVEWLNPTEGHTFQAGPVPTSDKAEAFCPNCGMDYVIGDSSGLPIQNLEFIHALNSDWMTNAAD